MEEPIVGLTGKDCDIVGHFVLKGNLFRCKPIFSYCRVMTFHTFSCTWAQSHKPSFMCLRGTWRQVYIHQYKAVISSIVNFKQFKNTLPLTWKNPCNFSYCLKIRWNIPDTRTAIVLIPFIYALSETKITEALI